MVLFFHFFTFCYITQLQAGISHISYRHQHHIQWSEKITSHPARNASLFCQMFSAELICPEIWAWSIFDSVNSFKGQVGYGSSRIEVNGNVLLPWGLRVVISLSSTLMSACTCELCFVCAGYISCNYALLSCFRNSLHWIRAGRGGLSAISGGL